MTQARNRRCPICGKAPVPPGVGFCSERCRAVDLGRWLTGRYAIPAEPAGEPDEEGTGGQP